MAESPYSPFDPSNAQTGFAGRGPTSFPASTAPRMEPQASLMLPYPDIMAFSDVQLEASYAYCFDRGGGQYTRLIPADMLPPLQDVPQRQQGTQGMIILPQPRALPPNGRSSNTQPVALAVSPGDGYPYGLPRRTADVRQTPPATPTTPADNIQVSVPPRHGFHAGMATPTSISPADPSSTSLSPSPILFSRHVYNPLDPAQTESRRRRHQATSNTTPTNTASSCSAPSQTRIDTIVASTPATPTHGGHAQHHGSSNHGASGSGAVPGGPASNSNNSTIMGHMGNTLATTHHHGSAGGHHHGHHHHHHHSHSHSHNHHGAIHPPQQQQQQQQQRRPKIYCDKWVHEGVCAFTQQGCKYKHEMPLDKATQHQLGLFHGLPSWWKKHQAELARQRDPPLSQPLPPPSSQQEAGAAGAGAGAGAGGGVRLSDGDGIGGAPEGGSSAGGGASCGGGGGGSGGSGLGGLTTGAATPTNPNAAAAAGTPGLTWRQHRDAPGLASAAAADAVRLVRGGLSASTHAPVGSRASSGACMHAPLLPDLPVRKSVYPSVRLTR